MNDIPATRPRLPPAAMAAGRTASIALLLESLLLHLLATLCGRLPRAWRTSHALKSQPSPYALALLATSPLADTGRPAPELRPRLATDGTHLVCEHPILWVIGPGPNRGMRRRPRKLPHAPAKAARAPPAAFFAAQ
jgi:hypothetical protein